MLPLYDMLTRSGGSSPMEEMARQYGLTMRQSQEALAALLPAFSEGLKRNAADPYGVSAFLAALSTGRHAGYFADPASAFTAVGRDEGNAILGHLFGSPEVSRAVAAQAAQMTGIAQETFSQMLPALAAMIMGGLFRQSMPAPGSPAANPLQEMMRLMAGLGAAPGPSPTSRPEAPGLLFANPFLAAFESMFGAPADKKPEPPKNPSGRPRNTYDDLFGQMFETGRRARDDYESAMRAVFDRQPGSG